MGPTKAPISPRPLPIPCTRPVLIVENRGNRRVATVASRLYVHPGVLQQATRLVERILKAA
jgi:hypothetical protein